MYDASGEIEQPITPTLMFTGDVCGKAEEAIEHYTSVFSDSKVGQILRYSEGQEPDRPGTIQYVGFSLSGQEFAAMDSARVHEAGFNEAISLLVDCDSQIDYYWDKLSAVPEAEQCGWLKDRFGVSWQISPAALDDLLSRGTPEQVDRVTQAFLQMKKFDIATLQKVYEGTETGGQ
jgi:predicted 3-demethylubiquinone-9 3-methyltransferase (glyoxalase superfamily)